MVVNPDRRFMNDLKILVQYIMECTYKISNNDFSPLAVVRPWELLPAAYTVQYVLCCKVRATAVPNLVTRGTVPSPLKLKMV
jgi:hypothetical protein